MHAGKGFWERLVDVEMIAAAVLAMWLFIGSLLSSHKLTWLPELLLTEPVSHYLISRIPCVHSETLLRMQDRPEVQAALEAEQV